MALWWGTSDNVAPRLRIEVAAMRLAFGKTFKLIVPAQGGLIYWLGTVELNLKGVPRRDHQLKILYPGDYPKRPPEAYVIEPKIRSQKYQYRDGHLSLFNPKEGTAYGWNPASSTAVAVTGWAIQWLYAYYTAQVLGEWPEPYGIDSGTVEKDIPPKILYEDANELSSKTQTLPDVQKKDESDQGKQ